ncbi:hypothetical protein CABS01_10207 [Colletotrichum abscissum]|uniref:Uncharacterized protein n=1 Tax=Colletotrichum abscissum TaxID=1671311 RepID=A0A9Q0B142_9PEZI|nr:uncharacterized protein CABS01_10207 [Colletotrichum abscissum]KAI3553290.1 hypothetical protein CABS02_06431 [Colletotrichum abscissum]KAK1499809.1 hypothetical protein CABS01_10207 [Colletotrichum abscissum]
MPPTYSHNEATLRGVLLTLILANLVWIASMLGSIYEEDMEWDPYTGLPMSNDDGDAQGRTGTSVATRARPKPTLDNFLVSARIGTPHLIKFAVRAFFGS